MIAGLQIEKLPFSNIKCKRIKITDLRIKITDREVMFCFNVI